MKGNQNAKKSKSKEYISSDAPSKTYSKVSPTLSDQVDMHLTRHGISEYAKSRTKDKTLLKETDKVIGMADDIYGAQAAAKTARSSNQAEYRNNVLKKLVKDIEVKGKPLEDKLKKAKK
jgi:hypothetical protein